MLKLTTMPGITYTVVEV